MVITEHRWLTSFYQELLTPRKQPPSLIWKDELKKPSMYTTQILLNCSINLLRQYLLCLDHFFIPNIPLSRIFLHPDYSFIPNILSSRTFFHPEHLFIPNIPSSRIFLHPEHSFISPGHLCRTISLKSLHQTFAMLNKSSFIISLSLSLLKTCIDTTWLWAWRLEDYSCVIWGKERGKKKRNPLHSWFQFISFWHVWAVILCCQRLEMECPESKLYYIIQWLDIILCWGYKWNPWVSFSFRFSYDSICDNESFLNGKKMECSKHESS